MLDKEQSPLHTGGKADSYGKKTTGSSLEVKHAERSIILCPFLSGKGGDYGCPMDCQHQYVSANPFDHHGFLYYHPGKRVDPLAEKRMRIWSI